MKNTALKITLMALVQLTFVAVTHATVDGNLREISCPQIQDQSALNEAVRRMIEQQPNCWGARNVYAACNRGNSYDLLEQSQPVITVCEKAIAKKSDVKRLYQATVQKCERKGSSRQDVAISNQCARETSILFGFIAETVKGE